MKDRFFVGQRVRIRTGPDVTLDAWCERAPGQIATITGPYKDRGCDYWQLDLLAANGQPLAAMPSVLVPIYDGDEKTAWSESAWKPMHLRQDEMAALKKRGLLVTLPDRVESK